MTVELSVVVAVYNEDPRNLDRLLDRLHKALVPTAVSYEIVFVNDGSRQPASDALLHIAEQYDHVKLVILSRNFGQQGAISAGIDNSDGDAIINIDSDCQDPPELIPDMVRLWKEGADVVYAVRSTRKDRLFKRLPAFLFYRLLGALSSVKIPWDTGDFRLIDRKVADALAQMPEKGRFLRGQVPWLGFKQVALPIERGARELGESTYTIRKLLTLAMDGLVGFSAAPLYLVPTMGAIVLALGVVVLAGCVAASLIFHANVSLVLSVGGLMAFFTGLQILLTGIVAIYVSKLLDEVRARPNYVVAKRIGLPFARRTLHDSKLVEHELRQVR